MLIASVFASCKNQWDEHNMITDPSLSVNLQDQINGNASISLFNQYIAKSKYSSVLASSKSFTVWAPNNAAMANVDPGILADTARLNQFVGNHISYQLYTTDVPQPTVRVQMVSGKSETFTKTSIEAATIVSANRYASNGVLHIINRVLRPKLNIWDYATNTGAATGNTQGAGLTTDALQEQAYLRSQNYSYQDTSLAEITGYDPLTGKPIPKPGTGIVNKNRYKDQTVNLSDETKQYTFFVMADAGLNNQLSKVSKYFTTSTVDSTTQVSTFNIIKDLVVPGVYSTKNEPGSIAMPDTIVSPFGVKIPVNMNDTIRSYNASNGKVYVMKDVFFRVQDKIPAIVIQGESNPVYGTPGAWFRTDNGSRASNIYYRVKNDPNGVQWKDIYIENNTSNGVNLPAQYWAGYPLKNVNTATYKVYIRAINDSKNVFSEGISFCTPLTGNIPTLLNIPYFQVSQNNFSEVYVGNYTNTKYGYNSMFVVANTTGTISITFDYIKLVPVIQ
ncbi:fasciclin domain-containing protein [Mucilaginibacter sp. HMF5004]|uniref:fasciclin domain-containing protein n=1 Tax=Mucilaginibacter rivuli TaxID=2857527 RepID=UPI001C60376F|nr:fasciclin domain-containing protein [Mucilaginibacter rivuli]MBW4889146.1 fasciclin domain-containing protein [Mucilaginibacter rivuli]